MVRTSSQVSCLSTLTGPTSPENRAIPTYAASSLPQRALGALFAQSLVRGCGVLLIGCRWIHTVGMRFSIDCVALDAHNCICALVRSVPPFRVHILGVQCQSILELADGEIDRLSLQIGEQLSLPSCSRSSVVE